jgi:hypothetical protein
MIINFGRVKKSRRMRCAGQVALMGEMRNAHKILVEPEGKRQLGKLWLRCEGDVHMDLREIAWEIWDWIHLGQDRDH